MKKQRLEVSSKKQEVRSKIRFCLLPLISCLLPLFLLFTAGCKKHEEGNVVSQSAVVIMINDREITYGEFQDTFKRLFIEGETNADVKDEELKNLKMALVNQFIEEELMSEEAKKLALDVSDQEISRELAEEVSLSPEGKKGGDLGFFGKGDMPKEFEDVVFSLPLGKLSQVIKTAYGYHIFMVVEKRGAKDLKFPEVKDQIINMLKKEKSDTEFQIWMKELKQKARIEVKEELL